MVCGLLGTDVLVPRPMSSGIFPGLSRMSMDGSTVWMVPQYGWFHTDPQYGWIHSMDGSTVWMVPHGSTVWMDPQYGWFHSMDGSTVWMVPQYGWLHSISMPLEQIVHVWALNLVIDGHFKHHFSFILAQILFTSKGLIHTPLNQVTHVWCQ